MSEHRTHEQRLSSVEHWRTWVNAAMGAWAAFLTISLGCFGWYITQQISNLDGSRLSIQALITSTTTLNAAVSDNTLQIRQINKELRDLQISNQLLNAKFNNISGKIQ